MLITANTSSLFAPLTFEPNDRLDMALDKTGDKFEVSLYGVQPRRLFQPDGKETRTFAGRQARVHFAQRFPERKRLSTVVGFNGGELYQWSATELTALLVNRLWPAGQLNLTSDARSVYEYLLLRSRATSKVAEAIARWRGDGSLPHDVGPATAGPETLTAYQRLGSWAMQHSPEGFALFFDPGSGKTPVVIHAVNQLTQQVQPMQRVLVVCPKNVRLNWTREIEHFSDVPVKVTVLRGLQTKRATQLFMAMIRDKDVPEAASYVIVSFESARNMQEALKNVPWDIVVVDESHFIKHPTTQRTTTCHNIRDASERRWILTGTPVANSVLDLWAQLEMIGRGNSGFQTHKAFKDFYGVFDVTEGGQEALVGIQNLPFMKEKLATCSLVIRTEEALPHLPKKFDDIIECSMTPLQQSTYDSLRKTLVAEIQRDMARGGNKQLVIMNSLVKLLRLMQVTSGFVGFGEELDESGALIAPKGIEWLCDPPPKQTAVIECLREKNAWQKTILWSCMRPEIHTMSARLHDEGIEHVTYFGDTNDRDREIAEDRFNKDVTCCVLLGNPAAGGIGVNFVGYDYRAPDLADAVMVPTPGHVVRNIDTNTDHVAILSQGWSMPTRTQSENRAVGRRTTRVRVRVTDFCVPGTIDEDVRARVVEKRTTAYEITDLNDILKSIVSHDYEND